MSPNEGQQILDRLTRMEVKQDEAAVHIGEVKDLQRATNGRVSAIEIREAEVKAAADEHRRMDIERDEKNEKWIGIVPVLIASTLSGSVVVVISLLLTGSI